MRDRRSDGVRGVVVPTLLCSLVGGGAVVVMALTGLSALAGPAVQPAPAPTVLSPSPVVAVPPPAPPPVTDAPTATDWAERLPAGRG